MVSVIIPIYNTSKYLSQCISSVLNQSFRDLEIILINDASTDNSLLMCREYAEKDNRVVIVNKEWNEGVEAARLTGLEMAIGEYVCFVDSDDWLDKDAIAVMYEKALQTNADYVEIGMQRVMDRHKFVKRKMISPITGLIKQPELFDKYYLSFFGVNLLFVNIWGKLYKSQVIKSFVPVPSQLRMGEDLYFNLCIFPHLQSVYIDSYIGYNYRFGGMTNHYNPTFLKDMKVLYRLKKEFIQKFQYTKANDFIRFELKNVLVSEIRQKILFRYATPKEIVDQISWELRDPIYLDLKEVKSVVFTDSPIVKSIIDRNAQQLYEIVDKRVRRERWKYEIKKKVSLLLLKL